MSSSNSNSQENFYKNKHAKDKDYDKYSKFSNEKYDEKYGDIQNINEIKRLYSDVNEFFHREKLPKTKKINMPDIKTDEELLFSYRNNEINSYNKPRFSNKKGDSVEFNNKLDSNKTKNKNNELTKYNENYNIVTSKDNDNLNLKKVRSEVIKRENETLLKKYEIYKNSDFEEYEKKYMLEKSENKIKVKEEKEECRIDQESEPNKINFTSDNPKNSNLDFKKIIVETEIKLGGKIINEFEIKNRTNSTKNKIKETVVDNQNNSVINLKDEKDNKRVKEVKIDSDDFRIREEKYNALKQKLDKIKNHQKKLIEREIKIDECKPIFSQEKSMDEKTIKAKNTKTRSLSSKISSDKQAIIISKATNNQNSDSKSKNSLKISVEKEIHSLRKSRDSEAKGITPENSHNRIDSSFKNNVNIQQNNNLVSTRNNKENISKEFKQVLNNLKIDNILQKTKMIFNKQFTLNSNLISNKARNNKDFDLKNIKISSNLILSDEKEKENLRSSQEKASKKPKSDIILNQFLNTDLKKNLKDKSINSNSNKNNSNNNQTSTIIINNNININTFIDKGDLIYPDDIENCKLDNPKNKPTRNNSNRNYNYMASEENLIKFSHENNVNKLNNLRNSEEKFDEKTKINREKLITNINPNLNWDRKEGSNNKKIPSSTKDVKREYSDNNYKNLLLCSYESGVKNSEFKLEAKDNNYNKDYERIKENLKKYESVEKYRIEKPKMINDEYSYNFYQYRNLRNNYENFDYRDANISPSYMVKNHKRINRPYSHIGSIDFDNKTSGVDYLFNNEKEKKKPALNFFNKYDNSLRLNNINY